MKYVTDAELKILEKESWTKDDIKNLLLTINAARAAKRRHKYKGIKP